jgi:UDP-N-acetylmuramoyl-tripeptide--D-alanyl-D-alanine ligase
MLPFTLEQLHAATGGELAIAGEQACVQDEPLRRIVTDSRQVQQGDVFWALPGDLREGSEFVHDAIRRGAAGVVTYRPLPATEVSWTLRVDDSLATLWRLARWQRERFAGRLVAVTGSVGKTTTRLMIDAVLARAGSGSTSPRNYNNQVGLPLSMLALKPADTYAVLELGASAAGEIKELAGLCWPQVGVITQIGEAHLGSFGSQEVLASAKAELLASLSPDGVAILNGDDAWLRRVAAGVRSRIVWVGRTGDCDIAASCVAYRDGLLTATVDGLQLEVPVWGRHHLSAVLIAVAVGREFGVPLAEIADGLAGFEPPGMRCQVSRLRGAVVVNDAYNASPSALRAALELLQSIDARGERIVVCGDMRELGPETENWHRRAGEEVVTICGADRLVACGHFAQDVVVGARRAGMHPRRTIAFRHVQQAAEHIEQTIAPGDVVLVKGSRALAMERIVEQLQAEPLRRAA